jgi:RNA polymerase sigma-B factor
MAATAPRERDDDATLLERWRRRRDHVARNRLVERHLPLSRRLAARYGGAHEGGEDLQQVAAIGLVKAIDRFDPERGLALSTFAVPTILGELKRHLRDTTWAVRVPRDLQEQALRAERAARRLERARGRAPTVTEIAAEVGIGVEALLEAMEARTAYRALSLDAPARDDDGTTGTMSSQIGRADPELARAEQRAFLAPLLARLTTRDREILRLRFAEDLTQSEIGRRLGVSQMHVSRLIHRALARAAG